MGRHLVVILVLLVIVVVFCLVVFASPQTWDSETWTCYEVNICAGKLPAVDGDGNSYLSVPLNKISNTGTLSLGQNTCAVLGPLL